MRGVKNLCITKSLCVFPAVPRSIPRRCALVFVEMDTVEYIPRQGVDIEAEIDRFLEVILLIDLHDADVL